MGTCRRGIKKMRINQNKPQRKQLSAPTFTQLGTYDVDVTVTDGLLGALATLTVAAVP